MRLLTDTYPYRHIEGKLPFVYQQAEEFSLSDLFFLEFENQNVQRGFNTLILNHIFVAIFVVSALRTIYTEPGFVPKVTSNRPVPESENPPITLSAGGLTDPI